METNKVNCKRVSCQLTVSKIPTHVLQENNEKTFFHFDLRESCNSSANVLVVEQCLAILDILNKRLSPRRNLFQRYSSSNAYIIILFTQSSNNKKTHQQFQFQFEIARKFVILHIVIDAVPSSYYIRPLHSEFKKQIHF